MHKIQFKFPMLPHLSTTRILIAKDVEMEIFDPNSVTSMAREPGIGAGLEVGY